MLLDYEMTSNMQKSQIMQKLLLLLSLAKMDLKKQYLGTYLGLLWALLMPLTTIILIYFVMTYGLKVGRMELVGFVYWLISGMLIWFFCSEAIGKSVGVIVEHSYLVTKIQFPLRLLVLARILACLPVHSVLMSLFLAVSYVAGGLNFSWYWLQCAYYLLCAAILTLGISLLTSAVDVFVRDTANFVGVMLQILFWTTPLFWDPQMVAQSRFKFLLYSPFNYVVSGYRDSLFRETGFWNRPWETLVFWIIATLFLVAGTMLFRRLKPHFADVI
jgi:ABC-type polysaccharide/polyol phosphate export permease